MKNALSNMRPAGRISQACPAPKPLIRLCLWFPALRNGALLHQARDATDVQGAKTGKREVQVRINPLPQKSPDLLVSGQAQHCFLVPPPTPSPKSHIKWVPALPTSMSALPPDAEGRVQTLIFYNSMVIEFEG